MKLFYEAENPKDFIIGFIAGVLSGGVVTIYFLLTLLFIFY